MVPLHYCFVFFIHLKFLAVVPSLHTRVIGISLASVNVSSLNWDISEIKIDEVFNFCLQVIQLCRLILVWLISTLSGLSWIR